MTTHKQRPGTASRPKTNLPCPNRRRSDTVIQFTPGLRTKNLRKEPMSQEILQRLDQLATTVQGLTDESRAGREELAKKMDRVEGKTDALQEGQEVLSNQVDRLHGELSERVEQVEIQVHDLTVGLRESNEATLKALAALRQTRSSPHSPSAES